MNNNSSKQILLSVIGVAILVVAVVGVSFAFFSYVYNSEETNTVETGTIVFEASDSVMSLENQFPTDSYDAEKATVSISGSTTYNSGIDFQVRVTDVTNASPNNKIVPRVRVTAKSVAGVTINVTGAADGQSFKEYNESVLLDDGIIATGNIAAGTGLDASTVILDIEAYYAKDDYHISDNDFDELKVTGGAGLLPDNYVDNGGQIIGTDEWKDLSTGDNAYSFKIQVLATQAGSGRLPA